MIVLVGKGITFDSGGLSLKTADGMTTMKTDMTGAAVVAATMVALDGEPGACAEATVVALLPVAENLPSGSSYRPDDVVRHYGGRTTEVSNTDAEGRLALADALAYAVEKYSPNVIVDVATLTGAATQGLSRGYGALFRDVTASRGTHRSWRAQRGSAVAAASGGRVPGGDRLRHRGCGADPASQQGGRVPSPQRFSYRNSPLGTHGPTSTSLGLPGPTSRMQTPPPGQPDRGARSHSLVARLVTRLRRLNQAPSAATRAVGITSKPPSIGSSEANTVGSSDTSFRNRRAAVASDLAPWHR